jgi:hypothetical protein
VSALDLVFGALFLLVCTAPLGLVLARSGRAVSLVAPLGSAAACERSLTRSVYEPFLVRWGDRFARLRWLQQGRLHVYLVYIAGMAVIGLLWSSLRGWWSS